MSEPTTQRRAGAAPREPRPAPTRLQTVWLEDVKKRPIEWLWKPFIQTRAINLLTGDPGSGKSTIVCDIAAALSRGRALPGDPPGLQRPPMNTWIMNGEDAMDDTIAWRLDNQGADPKRVLITDQAQAIDLSLAQEIGRTIERCEVRLLVVDPLQSWMGSEVDMNRANETREWASLLRHVALRTGCAIVFVRHRRKGAPGDNKLYSGLGSVDITGFARVETGAIVGTNGQRHIQRIKGSVGPTGKALKYDILPSGEEGNDHGVLKWGAEFVEETSIKVNRTPKALKKATDWLQDALKEGPMRAQELIQRARAAGLSERTLARAKLGVAESIQLRSGEWIWRLLAPLEAPDGVE